MRPKLVVRLGVALALAAVGVPPAEPAFSGMNGEVAYSIVLPNSIQGVEGDPRDLDVDLCTIRATGSVRRRITGPGSQSVWSKAPAWSAGGGRLAFTSTGAFRPAVVVASADGRSDTIVLPQGDAPAWAPSGEELAYVTAEGRIAVLSLLDGRSRVVAERGDQPAWSPDGSRIAYVVGRQLAVVGADGAGAALLTSGTATHASPNWSPDGRQIVFAAQADGEAAQPTIELINADGSGQRRLASVRRTQGFGSPGFVDPTWSPDGAKIAFVQRQPGSDATDVYVMDGDGTNAVNLTRSPFYEFSIDWRPLAGAPLLPSSTASCGISGTERRDALTGTSNDDVVDALAGGDAISVAAGDDIVLAGEGDDRVRLGAGPDLALGAAGDDRIEGGEGSDAVYGGSGADVLIGQAGADELQGEAGEDVLRGGDGSDQLMGGAGTDRLDGGSGRDVITGGDGNDRVAVRGGDLDTVACGRGRDLVEADARDRVSRDCERVVRQGASRGR